MRQSQTGYDDDEREERATTHFVLHREPSLPYKVLLI